MMRLTIWLLIIALAGARHFGPSIQTQPNCRSASSSGELLKRGDHMPNCYEGRRDSAGGGRSGSNWE
jgi:hypothetical protein